MPKPADLPQPQQAETVASTQEIQPVEEQRNEAEKSQDIADILADSEEPVKEEPAPEIETPGEDVAGTQVRDIKVETDLFIATFTNQGAGLKSFVLKRYNDDKFEPLDLVSKNVEKHGYYPFYFSPFEKQPLYKELNKALYHYEGETDVVNISPGQNREVSFKYAQQQNGVTVFKKFVFSGDSYMFRVEYQVIKDGKLLNAPVVFGPDLENNISEDRAMQAPLKIGAYNGDEIEDIDFRKQKFQPTKRVKIDIAQGALNGFYHWAAYETTYFAAIFRLGQNDTNIKYYVVKERGEEDKLNFYSYMILSNPGSVYMGPKDEEILKSIDSVFPDINNVVEYGWFGSIAKVMLKGINFVHKFVPNWGWAIVIFTLFLKIILFPLTYSSSVSMARMQTLQPKMKAIKKKYRDQKDPEQRRQMNQEMMDLYKTEKINPMGGCLPMLLQLPILFGLFRLLAVSISVRHEPWILWITDLSIKDPYYILPILMGITQIIVQKMTPSSGDATQQKMMYIMPVIIVIFVINLPSGLTLYWFVSNLLQIGQQRIINEKIYKKKKAEDKEQKALKRKKGSKKR
jgi:YidC/Oxa1 family membrane protein insertase